MDPSKIVYIAAVLLAVVTFASCHCRASMHVLAANCSYQYKCYHDISSVPGNVSIECQAAHNDPVIVKVILYDPTFNDNLTNDDITFIRSITSFHAHGRWPHDNLTIVDQMYSLKELHLVGNHIKRIEGYPFYYLHNLKKIDLSHNQLTHIDNLFEIKRQPSKLQTLILAHNNIETIPGFDQVTSLEELDLSYNSISNLNSDSFSNLCWLKHLKLAFNKIDSIPDGTFDNVTSLEELDLSNNSISILNNNSFSSLRGLKVLKLTNNKIIDLDGAINTLQFLEHLYLKGNMIQNIEMQSLQVIYDLETFDVSGNQLLNLASDVLARDWSHFDSRTKFKIVLSDNFLASLENATSETLIRRRIEVEGKGLNDIQTELILSKNSITNIEFLAFQYILHLTSLDLSRNKLMDFVVNAEDLKYITHLNLSYNAIRTLQYESFSLMDRLQNLDLSFNQLENVPDPNFISVRSMPRFINMSDNYLVNVNNLRIKFHNKGGMLDLSKNSLSVVNIPYGDTLRLLVLVLRSNKIEDTSRIELRQHDELKILDMSENCIKELTAGSLHLPSSLEYLDLKSNEITNMTPSVFKDLNHLKTLRLSHNDLNSIEYGVFQSLNNLNNLDLSYNYIETLDSKVFTDLQSLEVLSVRYNGMYNLDYKSWIGHKSAIRVNLDGNYFACGWLAAAISDFRNGISMIEPAATEPVEGDNNLNGIPCVQEAIGSVKNPDTDKTLLVLVSKILETIKRQNDIIEAQMHYQPRRLIDASRSNEIK